MNEWRRRGYHPAAFTLDNFNDNHLNNNPHFKRVLTLKDHIENETSSEDIDSMTERFLRLVEEWHSCIGK